MNNYDEVISYLIEKSSTMEFDGLPIIVTKITEILEDKKKSNNDENPYDLWNNLKDNYQFLDNSQYTIIKISELNQPKCFQVIHAINWLIIQLSSWKSTSDLSLVNLDIILNVSFFIDYEGRLWKSLSQSENSLSEYLSNHIVEELSCIGSEFSANEGDDVPIHEQESLERFLSAIKNKNWVEIEQLWGRFNTRPLLKVKYIQMLLILMHLDKNALVKVFQKCIDIPILTHFMFTLKTETSFYVSTKTKNEYVEFCAVCTSLTNLNGRKALNKIENSYLLDIFKNVSNEEGRFSSWMEIFNKYPLRYPHIQEALGKMLAITTNEKIISIYIDSISLTSSTPDGSRLVVSECLETFSKHASLDRKKLLWQVAYKRWIEWNFGEEDTHNSLFNLAFSELDFAVVGYYLDCITEDERLILQNEIIGKLESLTNYWHNSSSDVSTFWYRHLSLYQPIEHAIQVYSKGGPLIMTKCSYIPLQFNDDKYIEMLIRG